MTRQTDLTARRLAAGLCAGCGREPRRGTKRLGEQCDRLRAERQRRARGTKEPGRRGRKAK